MKPPIFHRITDYDRNLLPNAYLRRLEEGISGRDEWTERSGYSPGYPAWNLIYYALMCSLKPDRFNLVLETGTNLGCSAIVIAQALRDSARPGKLRTVELDEANYTRACVNVRQAGLEDLVELHRGDSLESLPDMIDQSVQVAFLDAGHLEEQVMGEFEIVHPHLYSDGIVIFDNTYQIAEPDEDQRVNGALKRIAGKYDGNLINFPIASWFTPGIAIWQRQPW